MSKRPSLPVRLLLVFYLAALLRVTVFRDGCFSHGLFSGRIEWTPFVYLFFLLRIGYWRYFLYLFVGNLVWFVPLGGYLRLRGRPFWQAALCGAGLSLGIETAQFVLGSGVSEVEDVILNTAGAALGWLFAAAVRRDSSVRGTQA